MVSFEQSQTQHHKSDYVLTFSHADSISRVNGYYQVASSVIDSSDLESVATPAKPKRRQSTPLKRKESVEKTRDQIPTKKKVKRESSRSADEDNIQQQLKACPKCGVQVAKATDK